MRGRTVPSATVCPLCAHVCTHAFGAFTGASPSPGDVSICIRCGAVSVFENGLGLRAPTAAEWQELERDPEVITATSAWRRALEDRGKTQ